MEPYPAPDPAALPAGITLASIGARAGAWLIDQVLVTIPAMVIGFVVLLDKVDLTTQSGSEMAEAAAEATPVWFPFVSVGIRIVYDTVLVAWLGQTVGMMALKIEVQSSAGGRLPWWQSAIRALVPGIANSVPTFGSFLMIGVYLSASFDERRRGFHDKAAGSLVVAVPKPVAPPLPYGYPAPWYQGPPPGQPPLPPHPGSPPPHAPLPEPPVDAHTPPPPVPEPGAGDPVPAPPSPQPAPGVVDPGPAPPSPEPEPGVADPAPVTTPPTGSGPGSGPTST